MRNWFANARASFVYRSLPRIRRSILESCHHHSGKHLTALFVILGLGSWFLFGTNHWGKLAYLGLILSILAGLGVLVNIVCYDLMCPVHPADILAIIRRHAIFGPRLVDLQTERDRLLETARPTVEINSLVENRIMNFVDDCRDSFRLAFIVHIARYLVIIFAVVVTFSCFSRALVLSGIDPKMHDYNALTSDSGFVDHVYYSIVTIVTVGYGDIYPLSTRARLLCIGEGAVVVFAVALLLNYIFVRESQREDRYITALRRSLYVATA